MPPTYHDLMPFQDRAIALLEIQPAMKLWLRSSTWSKPSLVSQKAVADQKRHVFSSMSCQESRGSRRALHTLSWRDIAHHMRCVHGYLKICARMRRLCLRANRMCRCLPLPRISIGIRRTGLMAHHVSDRLKLGMMHLSWRSCCLCLHDTMVRKGCVSHTQGRRCAHSRTLHCL
jgi:hypothetical protein